MKKIINIVFLLPVICLMLPACSKNDDNQNNNSVDSGKVYFHVHTYLGTDSSSEVDALGNIFTVNGRKISLNTAQFYISDIQLVKSDGSLYSVPNVVLLKTFEEEQYLVATVPVGSYKSVKFKVGLTAANNAAQPTTLAVLNHPEMWFSSSAQPNGYVFLNAQGKIDTTTNATGTTAQMQPFVYKIGTNAHYVQVALPDHDSPFVIAKDASEYVHMFFDYSQLFSGVQLNNPANLNIATNADNGSAIANTITNNIAAGFHYEE